MAYIQIRKRVADLLEGSRKLGVGGRQEVVVYIGGTGLQQRTINAGWIIGIIIICCAEANGVNDHAVILKRGAHCQRVIIEIRNCGV